MVSLAKPLRQRRPRLRRADGRHSRREGVADRRGRHGGDVESTTLKGASVVDGAAALATENQRAAYVHAAGGAAASSS